VIGLVDSVESRLQNSLLTAAKFAASSKHLGRFWLAKYSTFLHQSKIFPYHHHRHQHHHKWTVIRDQTASMAYEPPEDPMERLKDDLQGVETALTDAANDVNQSAAVLAKYDLFVTSDRREPCGHELTVSSSAQCLAICLRQRSANETHCTAAQSGCLPPRHLW
jgi:predicted glycoside hydrolase/deacetylase ChbG (UPF0249 family)